MLRRAIRKHFSSLSKDLNTKMSEVESLLKNTFPESLKEGTPFLIPPESKQKTMDQKLSELDEKIAKIEGLREAGRPEEIRIKNLPMKYGRAGRHPAYPWYGEQVAYEDRVPHLADRLGKYGSINPPHTSTNDWLQMASDLNNPLFHSFFVQEPSKEPDPDVDFEKGEIIYENPDAFNGVSLTRQAWFLSVPYVAFYCFHTLATGRTVYPIGNEVADHRADSISPSVWNIHSAVAGWQDLETVSQVLFLSGPGPLLLCAYIGLLQSVTSRVATKLQFNKNRDLVFVTKVGGIVFQKPVEHVYETTHLQVIPPAPGTAYEGLDERKIFSITCMNSQESFRLSKDPKYWNPDLRKDFFSHLHSLWS